MSLFSPSLESMIAVCYYVFVAGISMYAALVARRNEALQFAEGFWRLAAAAMFCFALLRIFAAEQFARTALRAGLSILGALEFRSAIQAPLVVLIGLGSSVFAWRLFKSGRRGARGQLELAMLLGQLALTGLAMLLVVRVISLHAVDALLFTPLLGPVRLNWILDIGFATAIAISSAWFARASRNMRE